MMKFVEREGTGEVPPVHSRARVHFATYLSDGRYVDSSRHERCCDPCAFQIGGGTVLPAWQETAATMRKSELCWVQSPPAFAFGTVGAPPRIPANETMWFQLELVDFRAPSTVKVHRTLAPALEEGERHLVCGRQDLERGAHGQARQAFRRALTAVPEKLLLGEPEVAVSKFATIERAALLNQALCSQRLAERALEDAAGGVVRVCTILLQRHSDGGRPGLAGPAVPTDTSGIVPALRAASAQAGFAQWAAKAHFRRGVARERLCYLGDALADYEAAACLAPADPAILRAAEAVRRRRQRVELRPDAMFKSILEREQDERRREEEAALAEEKRRRREARLERQRRCAE